MGDEETTEGVFDTGLTKDEYDGAGTGISKRPAVGDHEAEMQMPEDYTAKAYKFPFVITEPGAWEGFDEDAYYPTKVPYKDPETGRVFSPIKNLAVACGVAEKVVKGKVTFVLADFAGKKFAAVYVNTPYELERDGQVFKGMQSKVKFAKPLSEKVESLT